MEYGYKEQVEARQRCRPIHRYNRLERFKHILDQLLGCKGEIKDVVMEKMVGVKGNWESVRRILKQNKWAKLYNQIPLIIRKVFGVKCIDFPNFGKSYSQILKDFHKIHYKFNLMDGGKYFPNLRFVALTLIKRNGGKFNIDIPFIRTKRKLLGLNKVLDNCF